MESGTPCVPGQCDCWEHLCTRSRKTNTRQRCVHRCANNAAQLRFRLTSENWGSNSAGRIVRNNASLARWRRRGREVCAPVQVMMPRKQRAQCCARLRPGRRCDRRDCRVWLAVAIWTVKTGVGGRGSSDCVQRSRRAREWLWKASSAHERCIWIDGHQIRTFMIRLWATPDPISQGRRKVGIRRPPCSRIRFAGIEFDGRKRRMGSWKGHRSQRASVYGPMRWTFSSGRGREGSPKARGVCLGCARRCAGGVGRGGGLRARLSSFRAYSSSICARVL